MAQGRFRLIGPQEVEGASARRHERERPNA